MRITKKHCFFHALAMASGFHDLGVAARAAHPHEGGVKEMPSRRTRIRIVDDEKSRAQ
jgi:hypothetical protein